MPIHGNKVYPDQDLVHLYQRYVSLLPANGKCHALYKYSLSKNRISPRQWYSDKPLGVNALKKIVKNLTESAGLKGHFTNHSLQATTATRLFQSGVTGHKSDAVRMYKHSNTQILRDASSKIVCSEEEVAVREGKPSSWDDLSYGEEVLNRGKAEKLSVVTVPGENKAHKSHCHSTSESGCTKMCSILECIDQKQAERKLKKVKLSLKFKK